MTPINVAAFMKAMWPGVNKWFGEAYKERPTEYNQLFQMGGDTRGYVEEVGLSGFGLAEEKDEGKGIAYDTAMQGFIQRYVHKTFALGFQITQEAIEDNQYNIGVLGKRQARALAFSMRQTKEIIAANIYNRAFNASYTYGDGKALCASDHPLKAGGTFANTPSVAADLSEAALEQACIDIAGFTNDRGLQVAIQPDNLIIPKELQFVAARILKSLHQSGNANNDINALKALGLFSKGPTINHFLTDPDAWFIRTNCPDGMKGFDRVALQFGMDDDFDTYNAKYKARFRCSFGNTDPRGIYGSNPA